MELQRKEYPAVLQAISPAQAVDVLNGRMRHVTQLNSHIADWLQERRRVEEQYVQGLRKLAARHPPDEGSELGIFSVPWQKLVSATGAVAASHEQLARKIESDVERPLRDFYASNREVQAMGNISGNLAAMAKDVDAARKKSEKLRAKGAKAKPSEVGEAAQEEQNAELQWDSQAPFVFEKLQAVDESRLNHLRDALTQFQTHEVDQVERSRIIAEETLNVLLNIETADEIQTWSLRLRSGDIPQQTRKMSIPAPASPARNLAPPPIPSNTSPADDARSQKSGSTQEKHSSNPLKRFGTVLGRRRQSAHPYGRASSPEQKSSSNLGSAFGFGKGKNKDRDAPPPSSSDRPRSPLRRLSSRRESERAPSPVHPPPSRDVNEPNGFATPATDEIETIPAPVNGTTQDSIPELKEPLAPPPAIEPPAEPEKDAEGFSVPPSTLDAITEAEREAGFSQSEPNSTPQFKLDIRNAPIQEEGEDNDAAMASVVNTLRAQAAQPKRNSTLRGRRDVRNTIFLPNPALPELQSIGETPALPTTGSAPTSATFPSPSTPTVFPPLIPPPQPASPVSRLPHRTLLVDEHAPASDTQSIRSGRSLSSSASATVKHPDLHEPGLNASLVETVSAWFEQGNVTKAMVIGQVALAFNPTDITAGPFGTEHIRLENFPVLEKVAPNPAFIEQIPDNPGNYTVDLAKITKTSVAFHYQLHIEDSSVTALAPIILTPLWKAEATQVSAILNYSLNPLFNLHGAPNLTIRNLILIIRLEPGSRATSCQSKPAGTFSRDKSLIYWRLGDVTLSPDQPAQSIRARFVTDGEAKPGNTEARWEISGAQSLALGSGLGVSLSAPGEKQPQAIEADPFADEDNAAAAVDVDVDVPAVVWRPVASVKKISSGTYLGV